MTGMPQALLSDELDALLSALMAGGQPVELEIRADRLEGVMAPAALDINVTVLAEVRSAVQLVRAGEPGAAVSALLAARSALGSSAH
ncbi:MAG: hypothetical protein M3R63_21275 [Actinomycetota bacterium]|nr:hypothetical protein [Actinomycetota bacterium]